MYDSIKIKDDKAYIFFKPLESGLVLKNVKNTQFEIAGNDKKYYSARASVIKDYIQVSSSQVKNLNLYVMHGAILLLRLFSMKKVFQPPPSLRNKDIFNQ